MSVVDSNSILSAASHSNESGSNRFDIGVIFADQANYYCIPLSRLTDSDSNDAVQSVTTSCDCTQGSVVYFRDTNNQPQPAIRIDFAPETEPAEDQSTASLAVQVTIHWASGKKSSLSLDFLHSYPVEGMKT